MNLLCFDTTSHQASIAVLRDGEVVLEHNFSAREDLAARLIPSLEFLLAALGMKVSQVDLFGVAVGPGLFTGIRVGLAALKGLNFSAARPVVGVNTLEALACKFADTADTVVPMIDARKGDVYLAAYRFAGGEMGELLPPCLVKAAEAAPLLEPFAGKVLVGSGAERHGDLLKETVADARFPRRSHFLAGEIGKIAWQRHRRRQSVTDLQELRPLYLHRPLAEAQRRMTDGAAD